MSGQASTSWSYALQHAEQIEQIQEEKSEVRKSMMELNSKLPRDHETHGWVWLFLRKKTG